jgi:hypothetical protein
MPAILPASFASASKAGKKSHQVAGTLYHRKDPRIIEIDQFKVEVVPDNHLLLILNEDRPGVIGTVGHILGDHNINIARMQCSREERGGNALLIFGLDAPLPTVRPRSDYQQQAHPFRKGRRPVERVVDVPSSRSWAPVR